MPRLKGWRNLGSMVLRKRVFVNSPSFVFSFPLVLLVLLGLWLSSHRFLFVTSIMIRSTLRRPLINVASFASIGRRYAHAPLVFNWEDPLDSASLFTQEELAIQESAHSYCQERMAPRVLGWGRLSPSKLLD